MTRPGDPDEPLAPSKVLDAVEAVIAEGKASDVEAELLRALAYQIDRGEGNAAAVKEVRSMVTDIESRGEEADGLDELTQRRLARRNAQ